MDNIIIIIIECFYIIYMMCIFKTVYNIAHPFTSFNNDLFRHPIGIKSYPRNMICKFGKIMSIIMSIFIIIRYMLFNNYKFRNIYLKNHNRLIISMMILCLINFNAFLYMVPIFILELSYLY